MALNFPYRTPTSFWELFSQPTDRYKSNYDSVFSESGEISDSTWQHMMETETVEAWLKAKVDGQPE